MIFVSPGKQSVFLLLFLILPIMAMSQDENSTVTHIAFGDFQASDGVDIVTGSQFSIGVQIFFSDHWANFYRLTDGRAEGLHEFANGNTTQLSAKTTTLSGGIQYRYKIEMDPELTPYVGAGISLQNYRYDFNYTDSEIGKTSGIGYGPLITFGIRIDIAKHVLIIPSYQFENIIIQAENGDSKNITTSGLSLALVLRF